MALKYIPPRIIDISTQVGQVNAFRVPGFTNPGTSWINLPINNGPNFRINGQGHLLGLLLRAEGTSDAQYCIAGIQRDGVPSNYYDWPSGAMSPWWLNVVIGERKATGSNFPYQLLKFDTANNRYVVWADFPYPGWPFRKSLKLGARLLQGGTSGTLFVWVAAFVGSDRDLQQSP